MKIGVLGCKGTTLDLIHSMRMRGELEVSQVITLSDEKAKKNSVAFYQGQSIRDYCEKESIPCRETISYDLKHADDLAFFEAADLDLLVVIGWERLLPNDVLNSLSMFACGMHGSAYGLPKGRGRSPMNWAILTGHRKFVTYLFRYTPGMDDGDLIGFKTFDINTNDTIGILHAKNRIVMGELLHSYVPKIATGEVTFFPQPDEKPSFYPKRTAQDGLIDWSESAEKIHRLVRAVSPPYPGAFTQIKGQRVSVLEGQPFDTGLYHNALPSGTIVDVQLSLNRLVVKTGEGSFLITNIGEQASAADFKIGNRFESAVQFEVLEGIRTRYPDFVQDDEREI